MLEGVYSLPERERVWEQSPGQVLRKCSKQRTRVDQTRNALEFEIFFLQLRHVLLIDAFRPGERAKKQRDNT